MSEGFVYCWTDHKNNKLYVGVHKGTVDDGYICSSKDMLIEHQLRQADFTRQIIANGDYTDMKVLETKILQSVNASQHADFYNRHNGDDKFVCLSHTNETRLKMSRSHKGSKKPWLAAWTIAIHTGSKRSEETRKKMSDSAKTRIRTPHSEETKQKIAASMKGKKHKPYYGRVVSEETKQKMRETMKKTRGMNNVS